MDPDTERNIEIADAAGEPEEDAREVILYQNERTRVWRQHRLHGTGSIVCKKPLGFGAAERARHETRILARLASVDGVPRLAEGLALPDVIVLDDPGGVPLTEVMLSERLDVQPLLALALQLTQIIATVHRLGVVHKDINPANILLVGVQRQPMLIDFDLASTFAGDLPAFTHHDEIAGTLAYLAPEQTGRTGRPVDQRADLYALGATLYQLGTGRLPFDDDDPLRLIHDHLARVPTAPVALAPNLPPGLSDIILRLLEKEPDRRYQSAEGLMHDLARLSKALEYHDGLAFPLGEHDFPLRLPAPSRLIGRESEITALQMAFENALNSQRRGILVAGAPGVGKSALINELRPVVTARRGWFVTGKFDQYQPSASLAGTQALRALGRLLLAEPEEELAPQRQHILATLGANAGLVTALLPEFAILLGAQPEVTTSDPIEADARLQLALVELLRAIVSQARPLVMVLDDLQWANAASIRFIDNLLSDDVLRGLLVVGAYRGAEVNPTHPLSALLDRWARLEAAPPLLRLQNLPPGDMGALLADMLHLEPAPAAALTEAVGALTGGNPYDTVELINALRCDGILALEATGWVWDDAAIRRHIGQGSVIALLSARIARLSRQSQDLLGIMACLGGEVELGLLLQASGMSAVLVEERIAPALEDGLLVLMFAGHEGTLRFRHDRVQQAVHEGLSPARRGELRIAMARRLALVPERGNEAAGQYLAAPDQLRDPDECRRVIGLFRVAATNARQITAYDMAERYLKEALLLLDRQGTEQDASLRLQLEQERHAALYYLGRLAEGDNLYSSIEARRVDPIILAESACIQIDSLTIRREGHQALALGFRLLQQLGLAVPVDDFGATIPSHLDEFYRWVGGLDVAADLRQPAVRDPRIMAVAKLANRLVSPAFSVHASALTWLVLQSQRQWAEHGPSPDLMYRLSCANITTIAELQDYRTGYDAMLHLLAVGEARGYGLATSQVRFIFVSSAHWFEPLEGTIVSARYAREGLLQGGDLQLASYTFYPAIVALLECAPTLDAFAAEIESGTAFAERTGNMFSTGFTLPLRQLLRALRGETDAPGSFTDSTFNETAFLTDVLISPFATANFHAYQALASALFGDAASLVRHAAAAMLWLPALPSFYAAALTRLLQALSLAQCIKAAAPGEAPALLAQFDACRDWLAARAADAPFNFMHLLRWIDAERAWAVGDTWGAACAFDTALSAAESPQRPWHRALIVERAALFHLEHGLERTGRKLLAEARQLYDAWGAVAKVQQLERTHGVRRAEPAVSTDLPSGRSNGVSADAIDLLAILRASQALSSETSLDRLRSRVIELIGATTGATAVTLALWNEDDQQWRLPAAEGDGGAPVPIEEAGLRGLLPVSAFRYVERTLAPLLVADATRDDRFARDPYILGRKHCSLLVVPILSHGVARAILILENELSHGAFSANRLDAVMLIAGQLAVSLDNAMLYASLERKVAERTGALHAKGLEQQVLIQKLQDTQAQLLQSEKMASIGQLAAGVAHEINNPIGFVNSNMNSLHGLVEELLGVIDAYDRTLEDLPLASDLRKAIATLRKTHDLDYLKEDVNALIKESIDGLTRVKDIVQAMKDFSHVGESDWQWADVHHGIDSTLHIAGNEFKYKARIDRQYGQLPRVRCLASQLNQVFMNLIVNAAYAIEAEGVITIRTGCDGDWVWIEIGDNGSGIPADKLTRIFEPFFTTKPVGKGTGLGLSLSYNIVNKHGGRIDVASEPGKGSRFTLHLPVDPDAGAPECVK